jgi:hypothetical protein
MRPARSHREPCAVSIRPWLLTSIGLVTPGFAREQDIAVRRESPREQQRFSSLSDRQRHRRRFGGVRANRTAATIIDSLTKELASKGALGVLRHGFKCYGKEFRLAYFQPNSSMNPESASRYAANRMTITRQVSFASNVLKKPDGTPRKCIILKRNNGSRPSRSFMYCLHASSARCPVSGFFNSTVTTGRPLNAHWFTSPPILMRRGWRPS